MLTKIGWLVCTATLTGLGFGMPIASGSQSVLVERRTVAMGTELVVRVVAPDEGRGDAAIDRAVAAVARLDGLLSTWHADAILARANAAARGSAVALPAELAALLREAWVWTTRTGGAFDPTIGALVDAWDLRGAGRVPTAASLARALRATGTDRFTLRATVLTAETAERAEFHIGVCPDVADAHTQKSIASAISAVSAVNAVAVVPTITRHDSLAWIDSGGFGKGAALRAAVRVLRAAEIQHGMLNFGGQVVAIGAPPGHTAWEITVAHPARRAVGVATIRLTDRSAATTGQSERFVVAGGDTLGHVLDPRSGRPVAPWGSVTVVHRDPLAADVLSTALFVMGPEASLAWLEGRDDVAALFLIRRGHTFDARWNPPMGTLLSQRSW